MWLVDMVLIISSFLLFVDQQDQVNEDGDVIEHHEKTPMSQKLINMATEILFVLTQVFLFLKLDEYINWNWFAIFSPWLAYEALQVLTIIPAAFLSIPLPNLDTLSSSTEEEDIGENDFIMKKIVLENEYFEKVFTRETERKSLVGHIIRAWLAVFFALKLNGTVDWNWALVLLPAWVSFFTQYCFAHYFRSWGRKILDSIDAMDLEAGCEVEKAAKTYQGEHLMSAGFTAIILTFIPAFMAILLVSRLQVRDFLFSPILDISQLENFHLKF